MYNGNGNNGDSCFALYDNNGNARMVLQIDDSGEPSIRMRDGNGVERLTIGLTNGQPTIIFYNEKHEPRFLLHPDLFSFGEDGKSMFEMRQIADGGLVVMINSKKDDGGMLFGVGAGDHPTVALMDGAGTARVGMCIDEDGNPALNLSGPDGKLDWQPEIAMPTRRRRRKAV